MAYSYKAYEQSDTVKKYQQSLAEQMAAKPADYQSQWTQQMNDAMDKILNRKGFNYNLNGDALYQQYKDQAVKNGRLAMMDTMGQAAALTGGYGNSYAQTVGQQAYQQSLTDLNDKIPELYQIALDRYNMESNQLNQQYGILSDRENQDYGRYTDAYSRWLAGLDTAQNLYTTERNFDYSKYSDDRQMDWNAWQNRQERALAECSALMERGIMPTDAQIAEANLSKAFVTAMMKQSQGSGGESGWSDDGRSGGSGGGNGNYVEEEYIAIKSSGVKAADKKAGAYLGAAIKAGAISMKDAMNLYYRTKK